MILRLILYLCGILGVRLVFHVVLDVLLFRLLCIVNAALLLIAELKLLHLAYSIDVGEFSLHVPVFVKEVVLTT